MQCAIFFSYNGVVLRDIRWRIWEKAESMRMKQNMYGEHWAAGKTELEQPWKLGRSTLSGNDEKHSDRSYRDEWLE